MSLSGGEYFQLLRDIASDDINNGDYVVIDRLDNGFLVDERILTFSGITITRSVLKYACNATLEKSEEDI